MKPIKISSQKNGITRLGVAATNIREVKQKYDKLQ